MSVSWQIVDACCCIEAKINVQLWQYAFLDKVSLFSKRKPEYAAYFVGGGGKLNKTSFEEQMPSRPL